MRGPHNLWRLIRTGATFERTGAMRLALEELAVHDDAAEQAREARVTAPVQAALETLLRERLGATAAVTHRWAGIAGCVVVVAAVVVVAGTLTVTVSVPSMVLTEVASPTASTSPRAAATAATPRSPPRPRPRAARRSATWAGVRPVTAAWISSRFATPGLCSGS